MNILDQASGTLKWSKSVKTTPQLDSKSSTLKVMNNNSEAVNELSTIQLKFEGNIDLGKDLEPIYAVDDITGQVYYCTGNRALTSYMVK